MSNTPLQRFRHSGNPDEYGDWVVLLCTLPDASEHSCAVVVQALIDVSGDQQSMRQLDDQVAALHYSIWLSKNGTPENATHESEFWTLAAKYPALHKPISQFIKQVNTPDYQFAFQDEFHASAAFAIAELCLADKKWCGLLGKLLFLWDMSRETFQLDLIDELVARYGSCDEIWQLLAYRILADNQCADQQIGAALFGHRLIDHFDSANFARHCARIAHRSNCSEIGLDLFARIVANGKKSAYNQCWRAFHAAGIEAEPDYWNKAQSLQGASLKVVCGAAWNHDFTHFTTSVLTLSALHRLPDISCAAPADSAHWRDLDSDDHAPPRPARPTKSLG